MSAPAVALLLAAIVALIVLGYAAHRFLLYAERRGWVYYKHNRRPPGQGLGLLAQIYEPEMEHVVEEAAAERVRRHDEESGEDP